MSKSRKKQKARERAQQEQELTVPAVTPPELEEDEDEEDDEGPTLELPVHTPQALDEGLFHDVIEAATRAGAMREEGDRLSYLYNGAELSLKYTEPSDTEGAAIMVAVFRRGVVYQVRDGKQVVYQPGDWEAEIRRLAATEPVEDEDEGEE